MRKLTNNAREVTAVVITVGVDPDLARQIDEATRKMSWEVSSYSFEAYISAIRRPSLGPEAKSADICLAIVDFDRNPEQAAETAQYLVQAFPGRITVIALAKTDDPSLLLPAMRAGCSEFLYKPLSDLSIFQMFSRVEELWSSSSAKHSKGGSIISLLGAKGGVGTTTLATHLATYLVQIHHKRTLLIDARPELGHVCVYLGLLGNRFYFQELIRNVSRLDSELLQGFVARHASGLEVLSSPDVYGAGKRMDPESLTKALEFLRSEYDYVILDCALPFDDVNEAIIGASSVVYLVSTPAFGAIRDLSRAVDHLSEISGTAGKLHVVINRNAGSHGLNAEQIEKAIKLPVALSIPENDSGLLQATNLGETLSPKSKQEFAQHIVRWAENLAGTPSGTAPVKKEKKSFSIWNRTALHQEL